MRKREAKNDLNLFIWEFEMAKKISHYYGLIYFIDVNNSEAFIGIKI